MSERELQAWVSDTTGEQCSNLNKDCASGVLPITLLNTLNPNAVDARKMNRNASTEDQFLQNYKILEAAFRKLGIEQAAALVNKAVPDGYTAVGVPARLIAPNSFSEPEGAKPVDIGKAK